MKAFHTLLIICLSAACCGGENVFTEKFDRPDKDLRKAGWSFANASNKVRLGADGLEISVMPKQTKAWITYDIPFEKGKLYSAEVMVRTKDVNLQNNHQRGAAVFVGFLDGDRKWVTGGTFPHGLMGSSDWSKLTVPLIMPVKPNVKYMQIWLIIEGTGQAWFKDLSVREVQLDKSYSIDNSVNPPLFTFNIPPSFIGNTQNAAVLELRNHDTGDYFMHFITGNSFLLPHGLKPGQWEAEFSLSTATNIFWHQRRNFTVAVVPNPEAFRVEADFPNGSFQPHPELRLKFYPSLPAEAKVSLIVNDQKIENFTRTEQEIVFQPVEKMEPGSYRIQLNAVGKKYDFSYNNRQVKHKIAFRDDKVMMLDDKPFFPVGTYRDPSDWLFTFSGIKEAGFNMTHSYVFEEGAPDAEKARKYLAACTRNGVTSFLGISRRDMRRADFTAIRDFCAELSAENTPFVWYLIDEPVWQKINPYYVREYYRTIKNITPQIPVIQLHTPIVKGDRMLEFYGREGDIFWHDTYPVPKQPLDRVYEAAVTAGEIAPKQVLWSVIQAFDPDQKKVREKKPEDVEPKAGQIRCMTHLALAGGARGIIFYWLPQGTYDFRRQSPVQWAEVCDTTRELNELMPFLTGRDVPMSLNLPPQVRYWAKTDGSQTVLVLVNSGASPVSVKPGLPGLPENVELKAYEVRIFHPTR